VQIDLTSSDPCDAAAAEEPQAVHCMKATVLFADLRGYTTLAEHMAPSEVLRRLHQFFGVLISVVEHHGGDVFHVAGDCLMAGFAVTRYSLNGARAALACGKAMLVAFDVLIERWQRDTGIVTALGVGVHFGDVALGLLGPPRQAAWTLVGDTVNVADRLCERARAGEMLFSAAVLDQMHHSTHRSGQPMWWASESGIQVEPLPYLRLPSFEVRGRSAPVEVWCLPAAERVWT